jgi:hypothetical protein
MIVSDAPNCGITYDRHYDDRNSFIIEATGNEDDCNNSLIAFFVEAPKKKVDEILSQFPAFVSPSAVVVDDVGRAVVKRDVVSDQK